MEQHFILLVTLPGKKFPSWFACRGENWKEILAGIRCPSWNLKFNGYIRRNYRSEEWAKEVKEYEEKNCKQIL